jgi:LacI family transcriptional regulator
VLSGSGSVSEATRAKVSKAAAELGYVVNALAQAMLGTGRRPLAMVSSTIDQAHTELASGAEHVATDNQRLFLLSLTDGDDDLEERLVESLCAQRVAGVLLTGPRPADPASNARIRGYATSLAAVGASLIVCDHQGPPQVPTARCDEAGGVAQAVRLLASQGHARIGFLGSDGSTSAAQRLLGYSQGLRDAGLSEDPSLIVECREGVVDAHLATLLLLRTGRPPSAVICLSDVIALGVYRAARDLGVAIPHQLSVIGFGDLPTSGDLVPALTTVQAPYYDLGARAAELALGLTTEPIADLPTQLVRRDSTM